MSESETPVRAKRGRPREAALVSELKLGFAERAHGTPLTFTPDDRMDQGRTLAIAAMMRDLGSVSRDVSAATKSTDDGFLEKTTGKAKA